jgi:hypothetical protein
VNAGDVCVVRTTLARTPKDKLAICICGTDSLFFWINTEARRDGIGQLALQAADHIALSHDCYLDCSRVTTFLAHELRAAQHRGPISEELADRIVEFLISERPKTLAPRFLKLAIENLSALF